MLTLHFAHANGFPLASYRKLFAHLPDNMQVIGIEKHGHNQHFPVSANWHNQVQEIIEYIESHAANGVYGVGHSFGGVLTYMAACTRPDLFKGIILMDPPIVSGAGRMAVKLAKRTPLIDKITPAGLAKVRCTRWQANQDLLAYFQGKGLFSSMDPDCIQDYIDAAIVREGDFHRLHFQADVEAQIFRNVPDNLDKYYGRLRCPALLVTGSGTNVCRPWLIKSFLVNNEVQHQVVEGGHMFPLENPQMVAKLVEQTVNKWQ